MCGGNKDRHWQRGGTGCAGQRRRRPIWRAGGLAGAIDAVQKLLQPLLDHAAATSIKDQTDSIQAAIEAAKLPSAPPTVFADLTAAADLCPPAQLAADRYAAFDIALKAVNSLLATPTVSASLVKSEHDQIDAKAKAAAALVVPAERNFAGAMILLDEANRLAADAYAVMARDKIFQETTLPGAQNALSAVGPLDPITHNSILTEVTLIQDQINRAKGLAALTTRDHAAAEKLLAGIGNACKALILRKKMGAGAPPSAADIAELVGAPPDPAELDKMMASLRDNTAHAVISEAIKLRFGLDSFKNVDPSSTADNNGKSLKKIYELLALCPAEHTLNNPSLAKIKYIGPDAPMPKDLAAGFFDYTGGSKKRVRLNCGSAADTDPAPLQRDPLKLPNVEPDCEMVPDNEVPAPKYFDWTTLHEVGHAVDDKKRFMNGKSGDSNFGGWQVHGRDVVPVAEAVAKFTKFNTPEGLKYLIAYLMGGKPVAPVVPTLRTLDWATCQAEAEAWCDEIRVDKQLWDNEGASAAHEVDGRVYHEAYNNTWVSYELAARTKGITGYQFRAPGEWLSELYAAYHCKKLKPSHPAISWLATL